jgi:two-component system, NarL family, invasion response regulator UvrY
MTTTAPKSGTDVGVLTVDDQRVFREVAQDVIEATPGFRSIGEAGSGEEALAIVEDREPELVLVDVRMPGMDGIELTRLLKRSHPDLVVVLISIEQPPNLPATASSSEAAALVCKRDFGPKMLRGLWQAHGQ